MGANPGPKTMADIVEYCDGWMPIHGRYDILAKLDEVKAAWTAGGRNLDDFRWGVFACPPEQEWIDRYRDAGAEWAAFGLPSNDADDILPRLDKLSALL